MSPRDKFIHDRMWDTRSKGFDICYLINLGYGCDIDEILLGLFNHMDSIGICHTIELIELPGDNQLAVYFENDADWRMISRLVGDGSRYLESVFHDLHKRPKGLFGAIRELL